MTTLMQGLIQLSGHPLVHALGWTLLHFCWQGAAVALVLWCVLGLLGGRSSQARYGAACLALGLMVTLPAATFAHVASAEYKARSAMLGSGVVLDANLVLQVDADGPAPPWPARIGMALDRSLPWVLLAWFAGVIVFVGRLNFGLLVARRLKTAGTEAPPPALARLFDELRTRLGVARAVALLHSAQVQVPTVIGWLRPVVLLPASCLTGLSPDQIEAVLCHELAHVRRHDYLVSVIQSVIETVLFYHPAVWWVSRQVRRERECCCDELAVAVGGDVLAYARALSFLEESRASFPEFVLGANGGVLKMRIKRILGSKRDAEGSPAAALVALGMIVAVAGSYFVSVSRAQAQAKAQAAHTVVAEAVLPAGIVSVSQEGTVNPGTPAAPPLHGDYKTWLEQDVRWIITDPEAQAFQRLTNDEERDKFIEQFWARRDPPGAAAGAFREEIYRRIAYANQHFGIGDKPGWSTDQGHIYILYGQPDGEMSMLPPGVIDANGRRDRPSVIMTWHYNYIPGIGDDVHLNFVDTGDGRLRYTIDGAGSGNMQAKVILASRLLAPGGAGVPQSADSSRYQYLMPGVQDGPPANPTGISGTIVDSHGALVPGVNVTATNTDTGAKQNLNTLSSGGYGFLALPPGPYNVEFQARGFQRTLQENIQVKAGQMVGLNMKLAAAGSAQATAAGAAQEAGSISGVIVDPTGALVPRAKVTATNTDTGVQSSSVTDNSGTYSFSVPPGPYNVEVVAKGFQRFLQENVHVNAGQTTGLNLRLTVGAANENLTVTGKPLVAPPPPPPPPPPVAASAGKPSGPLRVSSGTMAGLAISQPAPVYPDEAKTQHVQGVVVLHARIAKDGTVKDVQVVSGPPPLIVSAIDAVRQWKYKPYLLNGEPTEVESTININYTFGEAAESEGQAAPPAGISGVIPSPLRVSAGATEGNLISKVEPVYPEIAKAAHVQGVVVLHAVISKTGDVESLSAISGSPMLTASAIEAVKQWKYKPYLLNGKPMDVETTINVSFTLADAAKPKSGNDSEPTLIYKVDAEYSADAKEAKFMGIVLVNCVVDSKGMPQNVHVLRGVGMGLDEKAVEAVKQYKFKPAMKDGNPVAKELNVEVDFQPMDSSPGNGAAGASASVPPAGPNIRAIDYKGLNSVTIQQVEERMNRDGVGLRPETPYDVARVDRAAAVLYQLLAEHGHPNAIITLAIQHIPQGGIGIQFIVKEGPKGGAASKGAVPTRDPSAFQYLMPGIVEKVGGGVSAPMLIYKVDPEYTAQARKAKAAGTVLLGLVVDSQGMPQDVRVLRGFGMGPDGKPDPKLKKAVRAAADRMNWNAVDAVSQYKFKPATEDGEPVMVALNIEVNFKIF